MIGITIYNEKGAYLLRSLEWPALDILSMGAMLFKEPIKNQYIIINVHRALRSNKDLLKTFNRSESNLQLLKIEIGPCGKASIVPPHWCIFLAINA